MEPKLVLTTFLAIVGMCTSSLLAEHTMVCIPEQEMRQGQEQKSLRCKAHYAYTTKSQYAEGKLVQPSHRCYVQFTPDAMHDFVVFTGNTSQATLASSVFGWHPILGAQVSHNKEEKEKITRFSSRAGNPWGITFPNLTPNQISALRNTQKLTVNELASMLQTTPTMVTRPCDVAKELPLIPDCCEDTIIPGQCGDICFTPSR